MTETSNRSGPHILSATVVARTTDVVWVETADGNIVALHGEGIERFPFSLVIANSLPAAGLGQHLTLDDNEMVPVTALDSRDHHDYGIPPVTSTTPQQLVDIVGPCRHALSAMLSDRLSRSLSDTRYPSVEVVRYLIGRGGGLTPVGDDILVGAMAAEAAFSRAWGMGCPVRHSLARVDLTGLTTRPSIALLKSASAGRYPPVLCHLFLALNRRQKIAASVSDVRRIGHSSGPAILAGISSWARYALASRQPTETD